MYFAVMDCEPRLLKLVGSTAVALANATGVTPLVVTVTGLPI